MAFQQGQQVFRLGEHSQTESGTVDSVIPGGYLVKWESEPFVQPHGEAEAGTSIFATVAEVLRLVEGIAPAVKKVARAIGDLFEGASNTNEGEYDDEDQTTEADTESDTDEEPESGEQAVEDEP